MKPDEAKILRQFKAYRVGTDEMLFFNSSIAKPHPPQFYEAMASLIRQGLVQREMRQNAYSLTACGSEALRTLSPQASCAKGEGRPNP